MLLWAPCILIWPNISGPMESQQTTTGTSRGQPAGILISELRKEREEKAPLQFPSGAHPKKITLR